MQTLVVHNCTIGQHKECYILFSKMHPEGVREKGVQDLPGVQL